MIVTVISDSIKETVLYPLTVAYSSLWYVAKIPFSRFMNVVDYFQKLFKGKGPMVLTSSLIDSAPENKDVVNIIDKVYGPNSMSDAFDKGEMTELAGKLLELNMIPKALFDKIHLKK